MTQQMSRAAATQHNLEVLASRGLLSTLGAFLAISLFGLMPMWILGVVCRTPIESLSCGSVYRLKTSGCFLFLNR